MPPITETIRRFALWAPVVLYMSLVFYGSSLSELPPLVTRVSAHVSDKVEHALEYAGLGLLLWRALAGGLRRPATPRTTVLAVAIAVVYGASDELHQYFVPDRTMDVYDLLADTTGATGAVAAIYAWGIIRGRNSP